MPVQATPASAFPIHAAARNVALAAALATALAGCAGEGGDAIEGIGAVQGRGASSPVEGRPARIEGVVTLRMDEGAFVQSLAPDADPATSEGLFLLPAAGQPTLEVGQQVVAEGRVAESGDGATLTTLADARITLRGTAEMPAPVVLDAPPADWEALEGMRVRIDAELTVVGNDALARFGEVDLAFGGRVFTPTEIALPGEDARRVRAENSARRLVLDDAQRVENPVGIPWLPAPLSAAAPLRAGSVLSGVEGVLDHRIDGYRLQATAAAAAVRQAARPAAPALAGDVRIAGMNLLNLFNGDGQGGGFPTERGARNAEGYARQLAKHVEGIAAMDPAIIAVQEVENDGFGSESALAELVDALNDAQPGARWQAVAPGERPGTDAIQVGIVYRADRVAAVGAPAVLTGGPFAYGSRPPVAQSFRAGVGPVFTVVSLHFKSKGGCDSAQGANRDQGDGQGCFNAQRVASARALHEWIERDPTRSGSERVALIGDFNAYAMEDPMRLLRDAGWIDPLAGEGSYSFVFDGQSGRLDHALLSAALAADLRGAAKWHLNADESTAFAYFGPLGDEPGAWRSSDHDPLLLGFDLGR